MERVTDERRPAQRTAWMWLLFVVLLAAGCTRGDATRTAGAADASVEGGILPAQEDYYAVDVVDPDHAFVVGSYGAVVALHDRGRVAELRPVPAHEPLFCVSFRDASTGVIGSRGGKIFRTIDGGQSWSTITPAGVSENVLSIARVPGDLQKLWAVGPRGMVLRSTDDGQTWQDRSLGEDVTLNGVTFVDDNEGWLVGEFGAILHTTDGGEKWEKANESIEGLPPYAEDVTEEVALRLGIPPLRKDDLYLFDVAFVTPDTGYIVAAGGFVLTTTDRGGHWTAQYAGTRNTLFKIAPTPIGGLIATGVLGTLVHHHQQDWAVDEEISHRVFTWIRDAGFSPDGKLGIAVGGKAAVLLSRDRGETWEALPRDRLAAARAAATSS